MRERPARSVWLIHSLGGAANDARNGPRSWREHRLSFTVLHFMVARVSQHPAGQRLVGQPFTTANSPNLASATEVTEGGVTASLLREGFTGVAVVEYLKLISGELRVDGRPRGC